MDMEIVVIKKPPQSMVSSVSLRNEGNNMQYFLEGYAFISNLYFRAC